MSTTKKYDDRISELPDSVLHQILSLMSLKSSAKTSILSKRWRDLCKCYLSHIKILDFGEEFARGKTSEEFLAAVIRIITQLQEGHCITTFRLFFDSAYLYSSHLYLSQVEKWIEFAVTKGVIELDLDFCPQLTFFSHHHPPFKLPYCVFTCDSLIHLNLAFCDFNYPSHFKGIHALKTLHLREVHITDEMLKRLVLNCPLLEELNLSDCDSLCHIDVSASMLKILTVDLCHYEYCIELFAPNLQSFCYHGNLFYDFSFKNISSLVDVILNCVSCRDSKPEYNYARILKDMAHVKILTLGRWPLVHIASAEEDQHDIQDLPITFNNLEELQFLNLRLYDEYYLSYFYGFFRNCNFPCLQKLFINVWPYNYKHKFRYTPEKPIMCTFYHLKVIQISGFKGSKNEMQLVKFLLEKAIVLETLILVLPQDAYSKKDVNITCKDSTSGSEHCQILPLPFLHEQLASLPKASPDSQIVLCEYSDEKNKLRPTHADVDCGY